MRGLGHFLRDHLAVLGRTHRHARNDASLLIGEFHEGYSSLSKHTAESSKHAIWCFLTQKATVTFKTLIQSRDQY